MSLPDSAFADRKNRRFPIHDRNHTHAALLLFTRNRDIISFGDQEQEVHDNIISACKRFDIKHTTCNFCATQAEKVILN